MYFFECLYSMQNDLVNKTLYLNCECGYETEISIATGDEEFKEFELTR